MDTELRAGLETLVERFGMPRTIDGLALLAEERTGFQWPYPDPGPDEIRQLCAWLKAAAHAAAIVEAGR